MSSYLKTCLVASLFAFAGVEFCQAQSTAAELTPEMMKKRHYTDSVVKAINPDLRAIVKAGRNSVNKGDKKEGKNLESSDLVKYRDNMNKQIKIVSGKHPETEFKVLEGLYKTPEGFVLVGLTLTANLKEDDTFLGGYAVNIPPPAVLAPVLK